MNYLKGYKIKEELSKSINSTIIRGIREKDDLPVIIKVLNREYPTAKELSAFMREYEIMGKISGDGIIKAYALEKYNNTYVIIMEDIEGKSIKELLIANEFSMKEKLVLAIKITNSLMQIHQQNIIHKDINPTNLIWNSQTNQLKIIDFEFATELIREVPQNINLNILEGTLKYIAPEQTGRINRQIDYRTDLYSLGITFYELFTGQLPFKGDNELELIHCHMAKSPILPIQIDDEIPITISDIIMKLISKAAEERYQSAYKLIKDLEYCLECLNCPKKIDRDFVPGKGDVLDRFVIPDKLYGREKEIDLLINSFKRTANGDSEFIAVSGYSGTGKSSLIHEMRKPVIDKNGYYVYGKYSQYEQNMPYIGIIKGFSELLKQLLTESQHNLDIWKQKFLDAMGNNIQVITDIIPELEQIVGPQKKATELNPLEAQNRFQMTFCEFIKTFASSEHPLVVFLDDLQWSDVSTLDLIKYILMAGNMRYILIIGTYRENEVDEGHRLTQLLDSLKNGQQNPMAKFQQIFLKPLEFSALKNLIMDTLHNRSDESEPLANVIYQKTKGNPFFINQMLNTLYIRGFFTFIMKKRQWIYDLEQIKSVEISDNVIDFLVKGLASLPTETMNILKLAACIGSHFDLTTISSISKITVANIGKNLWELIEKEIIIPLDGNYRLINTLTDEINTADLKIQFSFAHDRIRQAVYSLITRDEKSEIHLNIGLEYLKYYHVTKQADIIFELVNHLNEVKDLINDQDKRIELADLNITAGNKAKKATAYDVALSYFDTANTLLSDEEWSKMPKKFFNLLKEQATASLLSGDLLKADRICKHLSIVANSKIEKGIVSNIKVSILIFQGKLLETISEIRETLRLFDVSLPESPEEIGQKVQEGIVKMQQILAHIPTEDIVNLPVMIDPEKIMVMELLNQLIPPARQVNPQIHFVATLMMFELTYYYGTSVLSCKCLADCGPIMGNMLTDYKTGYKLAEAAFALIDKFKAEAQKPPVYFVFTYVSYWCIHYQEAIDYYDMSYRIALETGDLMHATYAIAHKVHLFMWVGKNLTKCKTETENIIAFLKQSKANVPLLLTEIVHYMIRKFQTSINEKQKSDFLAKDNEMIRIIEQSRNVVFLGRFYQYNTYVNLILGDMEEAEKWNMMVEKNIYALVSDFPIPDHYLFQSLIIIHKWNKSTSDEQVQMKETLNKNLEKIKIWAENCPANFEHKYYLLAAEIAIIENKSLDTIVDLFDKSISTIGENDFIQFKALCKEYYGRFWMGRGNDVIGKTYICEAYYLYKQWGAQRKVQLLEKQHLHYFATAENTMRTTNRSSTVITQTTIDMNSILKSTQAIASEIKMDKILTVLIRTMIENAGAQHGCILLKNEVDNQFYAEAIQEANSNKIQVMHLQLTEEKINLCLEIVQYVIRTGETIVLDNACVDVRWQNNLYIMKNRVKSVLCMPVFYQNQLKALVYLENNLSDGVFTWKRLETLKILSSQASISIETARLYENMEEKVKERTFQLDDANEKLKDLSLQDPLTNLHNRRYTFEYVYDQIAKFIKNKTLSLNNAENRQTLCERNSIGVYLLDIDHFKAVNDTYGHLAGDNVLVAISKILKQIVRDEDILVRWGGEEFLIILYNTMPEYLAKFAQKILENVKETPIKVSENEVIHVTCSLGYAAMPLDITNPDLLNLEQMINISDYALYCAKENGRNLAACFRLIKPIEDQEELKNYLVNLSKTTKLNEEYFKIEFVKNPNMSLV